MCGCIALYSSILFSSFVHALCDRYDFWLMPDVYKKLKAEIHENNYKTGNNFQHLYFDRSILSLFIK